MPNLIKELMDNLKDKPPEEQIKELRALARFYQEENNDLVAEIWDLDLKLADTKPGDLSTDLVQKKTELNQQLLAADYPAKIEALKKAIYDLEMDLYGASDLGGDSPYEL